jgi:hypothetical protein
MTTHSTEFQLQDCGSITLSMEKLPWTFLLWFAIVVTTILTPHSARAAGEEQSKLDLDLRYRYEFVDQDGFEKDAHASTLRTRLAYRSADFSNFSFLIQFDDLRPVGNDLYNSTRNGMTDRPVVADPKGTLVNQAMILYKGIDNTVLRAGRRRITLDNHRFIGDVVWRQNDQTYDGLSLTNTSLPKTTIEYAYIDSVNRIFGPDSGTPPAIFESDSHILNANYDWTPNWDVTAYAYFLDFEDALSSSNRTVGIRINGSHAVSDNTSASFTVEFAHQNDYGGNPNNYSADYVLLEGTLTRGGITGKLGYEILQGGSVQAFQTPLATLHAFQGWADKFLTTPADGIEDLYFSIGTKVHGASVSLLYHRFSPELGGPDYGSEWDLVIKKPFAKRYALVFKYANYDARSHATDTQKAWVMLTGRFGN